MVLLGKEVASKNVLVGFFYQILIVVLMSKLFHGNSKKEQANPKKCNNKQKPTVSATHLELSRCQPDMDFSSGFATGWTL